MRNSILTILVARGCSSKWHLIKKVHNIVVMKSLKSLHRGWPLSRQCEIPWQFHDISLTVRDTPAHVKRYSYHAFTSVTVSGGGRNATVPDMKPKRNPQTQQSQEQTQITINSFRQLFPDKIFSRHLPNLLVKYLDISLTVVKIPDISRFSIQVVTLQISIKILSQKAYVLMKAYQLDYFTCNWQLTCRKAS